MMGGRQAKTAYEFDEMSCLDDFGLEDFFYFEAFGGLKQNSANKQRKHVTHPQKTAV